MADPKVPNRLRLVIAAFGVVILIAVFRLFDVRQSLTDTLEWISGLGALGALLFVLLYIFATVFFFPGSIPTLGAGVLYGVVKGTVLVSIGATLGASAAFLVGRYLARGWVSKKISGNEKFRSIDGAVEEEGWKIVGLLRLSPIFPFNLLNYALGLTGVSFKEYVMASWIGMLPGTIMYVYIGSLAGDLATLGGDREKTALEWGLYVVGLLATVLVTLFVTRVARRTLSQKVGEEV